MKTFIIQERFTGYADIHIEADTEDEAIALYNRGHYKDSQYFMDDFFYNYEFDSISEMEACLLYTSPSPRDTSSSRMPSSA